MTDLFDEHVQEFMDLSSTVTNIINTKVKTTQGSQKSKAVQTCQGKINELNECIEQMEFEAREQLSKELKNSLLRRVEGYRGDVAMLEKELRRVAVAFTEANRDALFVDEANMDVDALTGSDQRQLLMRNTDRIQQTGQAIHEAERQTLEIQEIGVGILDNLSSQRETITRVRDGLRETDSNLRKSMRVANNMARRVWQNKLLMYGIMAIVVGAIGLMIYLKFGH